jgi:CRISPR system Cascade subunit CasB
MNETTLATPQPAETAPGAGLPETVARIARLLAQAHYPNGDRAALKRWSPGQPLPLAYYRLWLQHLRAEPPSDAQAIPWMATVWGLALAGVDAHRPQRPLGRALAESGFAQARLERLLSAPEALRLDLYGSAVRFLGAKGEGCNWTEWARYLLTHDPEARERLHRGIARSYYQHLSREAN